MRKLRSKTEDPGIKINAALQAAKCKKPTPERVEITLLRKFINIVKLNSPKLNNTKSRKFNLKYKELGFFEDVS